LKLYSLLLDRKASEEIPEGFFDDPKLDAKVRMPGL
jgi:hypothetical protein